jgi:hypothetical protein
VISVANMRRTIESILLQHDPEDIKGITDALVAVWLCESWTHKDGEVLRLDDLTDAEFRMLAEWARLSKGQYSRAISHIKDMREVFPGLGLAAANYFVRSFYA